MKISLGLFDWGFIVYTRIYLTEVMWVTKLKETQPFNVPVHRCFYFSQFCIILEDLALLFKEQISPYIIKHGVLVVFCIDTMTLLFL